MKVDVKTTATRILAVSSGIAAASTTITSASELITSVSTQTGAIERDVRDIHTGVGDLRAAVEVAVDMGRLEALPRAKLASYRSGRPNPPSRCFEGTRTQMLQDISAWVGDKDPSSPRVYCLTGIAGVGKTTIARTVAEQAEIDGILGGDFFFSRSGEAELQNPTLVFPTLAYQLSRFDRGLARLMTSVLTTDPDLAFAPQRDQLQKLIVKPLRDLKPDASRRILIVLDALDECEERGAREILQNILRHIPSVPFLFKVLITTRPEAHLRSILKPSIEVRTTILHDVEESVVKSDIRHFLSMRLSELPTELDFPVPLPMNWVTDHEIETLVDRSGILFVFAATALLFVSDDRVLDPRRQLDILLGSAVSSGSRPYSQLDELYLQVLRNMISVLNTNDILARFQNVVGSIVSLKDPLPMVALERLLGLPYGAVPTTLHHLHSVIFAPKDLQEAPRIHHPSFSDFIRDPSRCSDERFFVNTEKQEGQLALRCLQLLNKSLKRGMLDGADKNVFFDSEIVQLHQKVQDALSKELQYACRYWAAHLAKGPAGDTELMASLNEFAFRCLLWWLEALSLLGDVGLAITAMQQAMDWIVSYLSPTKPAFSDALPDRSSLPTLLGSSVYWRTAAIPCKPHAWPSAQVTNRSTDLSYLSSLPAPCSPKPTGLKQTTTSQSFKE